MSNEDERRAMSRKAAAVGLVAVALFEIGLLTWNLASRAYRNGMLEAWDLLELGLLSCVIIAQAGVVWIVVGRDPAANPARRALLCLLVAIAVVFPTLVTLPSCGANKLSEVVLLLNVSLAAMSLGILIAIGIGSIYFAPAPTSQQQHRE